MILLTPAQKEAINEMYANPTSPANSPVQPPRSSGKSFASKLKLKKSIITTPSKKISTVIFTLRINGWLRYINLIFRGVNL